MGLSAKEVECQVYRGMEEASEVVSREGCKKYRYGSECGEEEQLQDEHPDRIGNRVIESGMEEDPGTQRPEERTRGPTTVGGSQKGQRALRLRDPEAHCGADTGVCHRQRPYVTIRNAVRRCSENPSTGVVVKEWILNRFSLFVSLHDIFFVIIFVTIYDYF
jgi:hypothetical protein